MRSTVDEFDFFLCAPAGGDQPGMMPVQGTARPRPCGGLDLVLTQGTGISEVVSVPPDTPPAELFRLLATRMA